MDFFVFQYCKGLAVKGFYGEKENEYRTFGNLQSRKYNMWQ
jgi:hypothetical protein